jgi:hypothetical protein
MENTMIMVTSASDFTLVINVPEISLHKTWRKRGAKYPIDRKLLVQAYYDPSVESLFKSGMLTTNDITFLKEVGLMEEDGTTEVVVLTEAMLHRLVKAMPIAEVKKELIKLSRTQLEELADYAVEHYTDLQMDRIELFSKATGKNLMKAIEHYRKAQEV